MTDQHPNKRRLALKTLTGSAIAGGLVDKLPALWQRPLVQSAVLPIHAQGFSPIGRGGGGVPRDRIQLTLTDPSGRSSPRMLHFGYQVTRTGSAITSFTISSGSAFTASNAPAPGMLDAVFPAAYAQAAPPTTPTPLILAQDLELMFPNDQTLTASGMLELIYGSVTCDDITITVTLLPGRTRIQQIEAAATGNGMCGALELAPATGEDSGLGTLNTSIAFENATYTAREGAAQIQIKLTKQGNAEVTFRITTSGTASTNLDIATATLPNSGLADGVSPFNVPITFPAASTELTLNFGASRDELIERDETLVLTLRPDSANPGEAVVGEIGQTVVTIENVPPATVAPTTLAPWVVGLEFKNAAHNVDEGETVTVELQASDVSAFTSLAANEDMLTVRVQVASSSNAVDADFDFIADGTTVVPDTDGLGVSLLYRNSGTNGLSGTATDNPAVSVSFRIRALPDHPLSDAGESLTLEIVPGSGRFTLGANTQTTITIRNTTHPGP